MIYLLAIALAILTVAVAYVWRLAATVTASKQLITSQRQRIGHLEAAIEQQHERINWLVEENGRLEDRNACLERVQRRNVYRAVVVTPLMDGPRVLGRAGEINLN